ncbi:MAG: GNAT family N-acetyltransferase [Vulcanimicrobiaceae bacterium]
MAFDPLRAAPNTRALALHAEAAVAPPELERHRIDGAIVEMTHACPGYHFGNRFILDRPPTAETLHRWIARYRECFAWRSVEYPAVLTWFEPDGESVNVASFETEVETLFVAPGEVQIVRSPLEANAIVAFSSERHWQQLVELECATYHWGEAFMQWRASGFRALMDAGHGAYYGILGEDGTMLCAAGAYYYRDVARFAGVITKAEQRGRGLARLLITDVLLRMQKRANTIVIAAQTGSQAASLYARIGFTPFLYSHSLLIRLT